MLHELPRGAQVAPKGKTPLIPGLARMAKTNSQSPCNSACGIVKQIRRRNLTIGHRDYREAHRLQRVASLGIARDASRGSMERIAIVFDIEAGALPKQVEHEELSRRALATLANHINPIVHHRQRQAVTTQRLFGAEQSDRVCKIVCVSPLKGQRLRRRSSPAQGAGHATMAAAWPAADWRRP